LKKIVYLYLPEYQNGNAEKHRQMIRVEDEAKRDGYDFHFYEGNGFVSGVEFDTDEEAAKFIFKYLRNR
jgi:hypothetical protein